MSLDTTGFKAGVKEAEVAANRFSKETMVYLKGAIIGAFGAEAIRRTVEYASRINDLAKQTGAATKFLQEASFAAEQNGASIEDVASSFRGLSKARNEALGGNKEKMSMFRAMGIGEAELKTKSLEQLWEQIASTVESTDFGASEIAIIDGLLGRGAQTLIPLFKSGFQDAREEAEKLGIAIEEDVLGVLDEADDSIKKLSSSLRSLIAPALSHAAMMFTRTIEVFKTLAEGVVTIGYTMHPDANIRTDAENRLKELAAGIGAEVPGKTESKKKKEREEKTFEQPNQEAIRAAATEAEKILSLRRQILDVEIRGKERAERKLAIEKEMASLQREILDGKRAMMFGDVKESEVLQKELELAKLGNDLRGLKKPQGVDVPSEQRAGILTVFGADAAARQAIGVSPSAEELARRTAVATEKTSEVLIRNLPQLLQQRNFSMDF